jgi:hypothetical protein
MARSSFDSCALDAGELIINTPYDLAGKLHLSCRFRTFFGIDFLPVGWTAIKL